MSIEFLPSPFYTRGREAPITDLVVHWINGTLASADAEFTGGARRVSAHYGIEGAVIHQYVKDEDTAWHSGDRAENHRSIGIEHSAGRGRPASALTIATSIKLMVDLSRKHNIRAGRIYPHEKFYPTECPGSLPLPVMIEAVRAQLVPAPWQPAGRPVPRKSRVLALVRPFMRGADVKAVQARVGLRGANRDGIYGPATRRAVVAFQMRYWPRTPSQVDGKVGPATSRALGLSWIA